jgi:hypothetical protein
VLNVIPTRLGGVLLNINIKVGNLLLDNNWIYQIIVTLAYSFLLLSNLHFPQIIAWSFFIKFKSFLYSRGLSFIKRL